MSILARKPELRDDPLARHSIDVLTRGQAATGAFIASPSFPVYRYAWLRDGAFCATALDSVGEHAAARAFHDWVAHTIEARRSMFDVAISGIAAGEIPASETMPPARYTLDGGLERTDDEPWPNFQIDGYGSWLWALGDHLAGAALPRAQAPAVALAARYLQAVWRLPCFNCWEEYDDGEHASTLAAVAAGLDAAARLLDDGDYAEDADRVRRELRDRFVVGGRFRRGTLDDRLDGSLLWLATPFAVAASDDPLVAATVDAIRRELTGPTGGVYRYRGDTYYGGGEWLLLASTLAWHDATAGDRSGFEAAQAWVRAQARADGDLPEQVSDHAQTPAMVAPWRERWGPAATPLLWSHAMYLIAEVAGAAA